MLTMHVLGRRQPKANGNNVIASRVVRRDGSRARMPLAAQAVCSLPLSGFSEACFFV